MVYFPIGAFTSNFNLAWHIPLLAMANTKTVNALVAKNFRHFGKRNVVQYFPDARTSGENF